ncbi:MAG: GAF domain-containing protein [Anaerolineales bacterium]
MAISNAQLYKGMKDRDEAITRRNEDLALVNHLAATLASYMEVDEILEQTLTRVIEHLEVEAGEIFLTEEGRHSLRLALHRGEAANAFWTRDRFQFGEGYVGIVAQTGKALTSENPQKDLRYLRPAVVKAGFRSVACVPLTARGSVVGVISVATRRERHFEEREVELLLAIGTWAGLSIENARLHRQAQRLAVLEERERIGMDLHDGIIQSIYGVGLALDLARVSVEDDPKMARMKIEHTALFHICQEALANVAKHARATRTDIRLWATNNRVLLEVSDDGMGFDLHKMNATLGHGLSNMQARVYKVGGDVEINSAPGDGTTVIAWVPKRE